MLATYLILLITFLYVLELENYQGMFCFFLWENFVYFLNPKKIGPKSVV
jgi:hypothetical protein